MCDCSHSATLLQDKLVVFGGWDAPLCFNDTHVLDLGKYCTPFLSIAVAVGTPHCGRYDKPLTTGAPL